MLFNSYEFILAFLPATLLGFALIRAYVGFKAAKVWLVAASLFFYGWWNPAYLSLLITSMTCNFVLGQCFFCHSDLPQRTRKTALIAGITFNLGLIGYFKYAGFLTLNFNAVAGTNFNLSNILLPLAISFFTFQQIAYLVDSYKHRTCESDPINFALFVCFFPQLIAGPIVHHDEMMPQFANREVARFRWPNIVIGLTIFAIGLVKKVVFADNVAVYATPVFDMAFDGRLPSLVTAWQGALAYTLQLYFDFSGYSDMAIGSARLFGIRLPINFNSPYKAHDIIDFWRRWHMTLSRFLRDYVYIPLGGNQKGRSRRFANLFATMLIGGLWHGAGWTFVLWGVLHGFYLMICHGWRALTRSWPEPGWTRCILGHSLTILAVIIAWVFFRSESFDAAIRILSGMAGLNGITLPNPILTQLPVLKGLGVAADGSGGVAFVLAWLWIIGLGVVALALPNTQQIMRAYRPALLPVRIKSSEHLRRLRFRPTMGWACAVGSGLFLALLSLTQVSEFLYFRF